MKGRKQEKKKSVMEEKWWKSLKENGNKKITPKRKIPRKKERSEKERRKGEQDIKKFLVDSVKRKSTQEEIDVFDTFGTPNKRRKREEEKESLLSERKRRRKKQENRKHSDVIFNGVGLVSNLRKKFEDLVDGSRKSNELEKKKVVEEDGKVDEETATTYVIGQSSLVRKISTRWRGNRWNW